MQPLAGGDDAVFGLDRLQNLDHRLVGGSKVTRSLSRTSRVQFTKARLLSQRVFMPKSSELSSVERAARSGSRVEIVFDAVAKKKFVPEHLLRAVKNGLAGNKTLPREGERGWTGG